MEDSDELSLDLAEGDVWRIAPMQDVSVVAGLRDHGRPPARRLVLLVPIGGEHDRARLLVVPGVARGRGGLG